jgi:hypothetical protein
MHIDASGGWRERYMFDKDGPMGIGECLPDISMHAASQIQARLEKMGE